MCNDDSYIANETARGELEDTQYKTKLGTCGPTQCARGKPQQNYSQGEKPTDNLASTLLLYQLHKIMQTHQNKTALKQCAGNLRKGNTKKLCTNTYTNSNQTKYVYSSKLQQ